MKSIKLLVLLCSLASLGWSQYGTGTILGTITDPTGAVVVGATVCYDQGSNQNGSRYEEDNHITRGPEGVYARPSDHPGFGWDIEVT